MHFSPSLLSITPGSVNYFFLWSNYLYSRIVSGTCACTVVTQDVSDADLPSLIFSSLRKLDKTSIELTNRLKSGINAERNKIRDIRNRVNTAKAKVEHLRGYNQAIRVYSSSKYPLADTAGTSVL